MPHGNASQLWKNTRIHTETRELKESQTETGSGLNTLTTPCQTAGWVQANVLCEQFPPECACQHESQPRRNTRKHRTRTSKVSKPSRPRDSTPVKRRSRTARVGTGLRNVSCENLPLRKCMPHVSKTQESPKDIQWSNKAHWNCTNFLSENGRKGADPK